MRTLGSHHHTALGRNGFAGFFLLWVFALQREARLEHDLIVVHLTVLHVPASLHDLKPVQVSQGLIRTLNRGLDRILDAALRRAYQFNGFVDVMGHLTLPTFCPRSQVGQTMSPASPS